MPFLNFKAWYANMLAGITNNSTPKELTSNMSINLSGYRVDFKYVYQSQWIQS